MNTFAPHILIVDDDAGIREALRDWFEKCNHCTAVAASCSDEAFEHLRKGRFDAVITGVNQLEMDGLEMTAVIRRMGGPPVIVMTGHYFPEVRRQAYISGAKAFLRKPFLLERLAQAVYAVAWHGLHFVGPVETNS